MFTDGELQENYFHEYAITMYFPQERAKKNTSNDISQQMLDIFP